MLLYVFAYDILNNEFNYLRIPYTMLIPLPYYFYLLSEKQFAGHEISIIGSEIETTGAHALSY